MRPGKFLPQGLLEPQPATYVGQVRLEAPTPIPANELDHPTLDSSTPTEIPKRAGELCLGSSVVIKTGPSRQFLPYVNDDGPIDPFTRLPEMEGKDVAGYRFLPIITSPE